MQKTREDYEDELHTFTTALAPEETVAVSVEELLALTEALCELLFSFAFNSHKPGAELGRTAFEAHVPASVRGTPAKGARGQSPLKKEAAGPSPFAIKELCASHCCDSSLDIVSSILLFEGPSDE